MNYLAHLTLSFDNPALMVGNFVADFTRRKLYPTFPAAVRQGIELHHYIDHFTDSHPTTEAARALLRPRQAKYSGVVLDMFYDHFLARQYARWGRASLDQFAHNSYAVLGEAQDLFPAKAARTLRYMQGGDWLRAYASEEGLAKSLAGLSRRAGFDNAMAQAMTQLQTERQFFEEGFESFYPQLKQAVTLWLANAS